METFVVEVCKGIVTNVRKDTTREGWWVPARSLPRHAAAALGADKGTARASLSWDTHKRGWRDMKNAHVISSTYANAVIVTMDDGGRGIALLDF